jgi:hypothetical protein
MAEECMCCERDATGKCNGCGEAYYCGAECQVADWDFHQDECGNMQIGGPIDWIKRKKDDWDSAKARNETRALAKRNTKDSRAANKMARTARKDAFRNWRTDFSQRFARKVDKRSTPYSGRSDDGKTVFYNKNNPYTRPTSDDERY